MSPVSLPNPNAAWQPPTDGMTLDAARALRARMTIGALLAPEEWAAIPTTFDWLIDATTEARAGWYQNRDKADLCDSLLVMLDRVTAIDPAEHATSSRDYGRGYAQAIRDVRAALEVPS